MAVPYLQVDNLTKSFGDLVLFENISFGIAEGQRVGLIAKNGSGKTTVLRDLARLLSTKGKKNVALIDERGELAGTASGKFQNDIGMCDVYDSYNKSEAMLHAIRSMAPEIVICDEIGSKEDIYAVEKSVNCGVRIISSTHCANEYELKQKANMVSLMKTGAFQTLVFLSNRTHAGEIVKISQVGDNFAV